MSGRLACRRDARRATFAALVSCLEYKVIALGTCPIALFPLWLTTPIITTAAISAPLGPKHLTL